MGIAVPGATPHRASSKAREQFQLSAFAQTRARFLLNNLLTEETQKAGQGYSVVRPYPANRYPLITNIFLLGSFCGNNLSSRLVYHHGVQKALRCLCHTSRISRETSAAGLTRSFCFRNRRYRNCYFQTRSAFLLRGMSGSAWAHGCRRSGD